MTATQHESGQVAHQGFNSKGAHNIETSSSAAVLAAMENIGVTNVIVGNFDDQEAHPLPDYGKLTDRADSKKYDHRLGTYRVNEPTSKWWEKVLLEFDLSAVEVFIALWIKHKDSFDPPAGTTRDLRKNTKYQNFSGITFTYQDDIETFNEFAHLAAQTENKKATLMTHFIEHIWSQETNQQPPTPPQRTPIDLSEIDRKLEQHDKEQEKHNKTP